MKKIEILYLFISCYVHVTFFTMFKTQMRFIEFLFRKFISALVTTYSMHLQIMPFQLRQRQKLQLARFTTVPIFRNLM